MRLLLQKLPRGATQIQPPDEPLWAPELRRALVSLEALERTMAIADVRDEELVLVANEDWPSMVQTAFAQFKDDLRLLVQQLAAADGIADWQTLPRELRADYLVTAYALVMEWPVPDFANTSGAGSVPGGAS